MRNRKTLIVRILAAIFAAVMVVSFIFVTMARAESLGVSIKVTPKEIASVGDEVKVTISLSNPSAFFLENISVSSDVGVAGPLGSLAPGETQTYDFDVIINEYMIDGAIPVTFDWTEEGIEQRTESNFEVKLKKSKPAISLKRTVGKETVIAGEETTVTYVVQNTGDVELTNVTVTDELSTTPIVTGLTLAPKDKKTIDHKFMLMTATLSKPTVKATGPDGKEITETLKEINIEPLIAKLAVNTDVGETTDDGTKVAVVVKNEGNVDVVNIIVRDDQNVVIKDGLTLKQGEEKTFEHIVDPLSERKLVITVSGKVKGSETPIMAQSVPEHLQAAYNPEDVLVSLEAIVPKSTMDKPGDLAVQIMINNQSPIGLLGVSLEEASAGELKQIEQLPPGVTRVDVQMPVTETSSLLFTIKALDDQGRSYEFAATPVQVTVFAIPSPSPTAIVTEAPIAESTTGGMNWFALLIMLGVLFVILLVALIVILVKEKQSKKDQNDLDFVTHQRNRDFAPRVPMDSQAPFLAPTRKQIPPQSPHNPAYMPTQKPQRPPMQPQPQVVRPTQPIKQTQNKPVLKNEKTRAPKANIPVQSPAPQQILKSRKPNQGPIQANSQTLQQDARRAPVKPNRPVNSQKTSPVQQAPKQVQPQMRKSKDTLPEMGLFENEFLTQDDLFETEFLNPKDRTDHDQ